MGKTKSTYPAIRGAVRNILAVRRSEGSGETKTTMTGKCSRGSLGRCREVRTRGRSQVTSLCFRNTRDIDACAKIRVPECLASVIQKVAAASRSPCTKS